MALVVGENSGFGRNDANAGTDPWSDKTWGQSALSISFDNAGVGSSSFQGDLFPFSADPTIDLQSQLLDPISQATEFLFEDNVFRETGNHQEDASRNQQQPQPLNSEPTEAPDHSKSGGTVLVAIHEQVSALYDGVTDEPVCHVEGSIYVHPSEDLQAVPFLLVIRDLENHVASWKDWPSNCFNVSDEISRKGLHRTDRVLQIKTKANSEKPHAVALPEQSLVAQYVCSDRVRPVPLLIKSRVVFTPRFCRVGFKIRANPSNNLPLTRVVLLLAVPPHIDGQTAKLSRKGGAWDELKRTVSWIIPKLEPGQALEIQAQFDGPPQEGTAENGTATLRFPILARGDYAASYSTLEVRKSDGRDGVSRPVETLKVNRSATVLHRKV